MTKETNERLGQLIRAFRKNKDLTMQELGKLVGVAGSQISKYERGKNTISVPMLIELSKALEVSSWETLTKLEGGAVPLYLDVSKYNLAFLLCTSSNEIASFYYPREGEEDEECVIYVKGLLEKILWQSHTLL